jgi:hypothetical protein
MSAKNSLGDQFVRVFHSSDSPLPVHEQDSDDYAQKIRKSGHLTQSNPQGRFIYAGTEAAAKSLISRNYIHKYDIPVSMVRPELWGDDMMQSGDTPLGLKSGEQPELWETQPADVSLVNPTSAIKFRNSVEDYGSISHIFHKDSVKNGLVRYAGMEKVDNG